MRVWNFDIPKPDEAQTIQIEMPAGADIIQVEAGRILAVVNPEAPAQKRTFRVVKTGQDFNPEGTQYIGTYWVKGAGNSHKAFHVFLVNA